MLWWRRNERRAAGTALAIGGCRIGPLLGGAADLVLGCAAGLLLGCAAGLLLGCAAGLLLGCASTHFDGQVFRSGEIAFRVGPIPARWRQISVDESALAFRDDGAGATVAVKGRCGKDAEDIPLAALTQHLFLQFTDRTILRQELEQLDGREALVTEMDAALDGVRKHFVVVVLKKDNCVYDVMHVAADARGGNEDFEAFYRGFATVE